MAEYKMLPEINRCEVPEKPTGSKWVQLFDKLPPDKAIPFECETVKAAKRLRGAIKYPLGRRQRDYKFHARRVDLTPGGKCILYVWKEEIKGGDG